MKRHLIMMTVAAALLLLGSTAAMAGDFRGSAKLGWVYLDQEGNQGINQPTYNLYEGGALSLEKFRYRWDNGFRLFGDFKNITLNNRNLVLGVEQSGHGGVNLRHNKYRRVYSFDGDRFTRREKTYGTAWYRPIDNIRLFGGYGLTRKAGDMLDLFEPPGSLGLTNVDYSQQYYHAGVEYSYERSTIEFEYRGSSFSDDISELNDRATRRWRVTAVSPIPRYDNIFINGGFQSYEGRMSERDDTLTANTAWVGARAYYGDGWSLRYSFIFDRARRTGDLSATDNIVNAIYGGKTWRGKGGVQVGYRNKINDDVADELSTNGYFFSAWYRVMPDLTIRGGYGSEVEEVQEGRTLTGDEDRTRHWGQIKYRNEYGTLRLKAENRQTENDDIGVTADFMRFASDVSFDVARYGSLIASWSYTNGEYENIDGVFEMEQHVFSGDIYSIEYMKTQLGFGGTYVRSRKDLDVESFSVRISGLYEFIPNNKLEVVYSVHNFDNFADDSPIYQEYYTANVVEVNLIHDF